MADTQNTVPDYLSQDCELWKPISGYEGLYSVSNSGNVWREDKISWGDPIPCGHVLKPWLTATGYFWVRLSRKNRGEKYAIHYLVALTFLGPKPDGCVVNHKDACKTNNHVSNLEYMTPQENSAHAARLGRFISGDSHWTRTKPENRLRGESHFATKLTEDQVREIRARYKETAITQAELAEEYGVLLNVIHSIVRYKTWLHVED